jgi:hypothetical protein
MMNVIVFSILFILFLYCIIPPQQEGFNTYFRQCVRPHIRTFRDCHESIMYYFNTKTNDLRQIIGISY